MTQNVPLNHGDPAVEAFFDAVQEVLSGVAVNFEVVQIDPTTVRVPAGPADAQVGISVDGFYRFNSANADRQHPGGGAGVYDLHVTALANEVATKAPPALDYSFALAITPTGVPPAGAALSRIVRRLQWDGAAITRIDRLDVERPGSHAATHAAGGADPLPADSVTAVQLAPDAVGASEIAAGAVGSPEIADDAVTASEIAPNAVGASELADNAVDTGAIADDAVTAPKIAANAVGTSELADNAVDQAALQDNAVGLLELAAAALLGRADVLGDLLSSSARVHVGSALTAANDSMTAYYAMGIRWDDGDGRWENDPTGGNNGWVIIGMHGVTGMLRIYSDADSGNVVRNYTAAQVQALSRVSVAVTGNPHAGGRRLVSSLHDLYANRPAASAALNGVRFFATDKGMEWACDGAGWTLVAVFPLRVVSLPASPIDGQECYYVADAAAGIIWHLRYNAGSASAFKWEPTGQPAPLQSYVATNETAGGVYTALATPQSVTTPLAGDYDVGVVLNAIAGQGDGGALASVALGATEPDFANPALAVFNQETFHAANSERTVGRVHRFTGLAAGIAVALRARTHNGGTPQFNHRRLTVTPVRVG